MTRGAFGDIERVLAIAPHPDDETLGCGGALLRHVSEGAAVYWLIVTDMSDGAFPVDVIERRRAEIDRVAAYYGFAQVFKLGFPAARLDEVAAGDLVTGIGGVVRETGADTLYLPNRDDAHSDHRAVFDAAAAATKWFRYPSVRRVRVYETLSESDVTLRKSWTPNLFLDITEHLDAKIEAMRMFESEIGAHPFPRSEPSIRALATLRGAASGFQAAEAFDQVLERI